jgi:hypothetical protein
MLNSASGTATYSAAARRQKLLQQALDGPAAPGISVNPANLFKQLVDHSLADLPPPGSGRTLERWRALCDVANCDLSLVKLFEGHADALAIQRELCPCRAIPAEATWGVWAAEPPDARLWFQEGADEGVTLHGRKSWCSGASLLSHALVTAWCRDGSGPWLVAVVLNQPGVRVTGQGWQAVGMAGSASVDVEFDGAFGHSVGGAGDYLSRPGFWQGGAGIGACWYGGALALARTLRSALSAQGKGGGNAVSAATAAGFARAMAMGRVDVALQQTAALLRSAAAWIDRHPQGDAGEVALRVRLSAEQSAARVLEQVGLALGAGPFCRDARFARMAADLPVFLRQSGADRDFMALGEKVAAATSDAWAL